MKKKLYFIMSMLLVFSLLLVGCGGKTTLKMATGGTTGTYYAYSGAVSQVLSQKLRI